MGHFQSKKKSQKKFSCLQYCMYNDQIWTQHVSWYNTTFVQKRFFNFFLGGGIFWPPKIVKNHRKTTKKGSTSSKNEILKKLSGQKLYYVIIHAVSKFHHCRCVIGCMKTPRVISLIFHNFDFCPELYIELWRIFKFQYAAIR